MAGLTEGRPKRDVPDALVISSDLGAVGFCYSPQTHDGKHPKDTFVVKLTVEQMDEIRDKAQTASQRLEVNAPDGGTDRRCRLRRGLDPSQPSG